MPHIILEYSENIIEKDNFSPLFKDVHMMLSEQLPTNLSSCKSRACKYEQFYVGDGSSQNAFIHMTIKIMTGRSSGLLDHVGNQIMERLRNYFKESAILYQLSITLEIDELQDRYFK